jgi:hypothetical protein
MISTGFNPTQLWLEFSADERDRAWQQSQAMAIAGDRWTAYLNQLCLNTVLPWLRAEHWPEARVWTSRQALSSFWALVNGTAVTAGPIRLVLIPTEVIDLDELSIPQEWVDLPSWAADYYLTVQVEPDECWLRVGGYTTQARLKALARYDARDRTYRLDEVNLISDLNVLWQSRQVCPEEATRADIAAIPALALSQATPLIERLGNPALLTPRLEVPFTLWGALLEHGGWRQQLAERRQGVVESRSLVQWLQSGISALARQAGWEQLELQPSALGARGNAPEMGREEGGLFVSRRLVIAGQPYDLQIYSQGLTTHPTWRFELRSATPGGSIPSGFKLRLLTEDLQGFDDNQAEAIVAVDVLFVEVAVESGEGLVWEVEPWPEERDREILRF